MNNNNLIKGFLNQFLLVNDMSSTNYNTDKNNEIINLKDKLKQAYQIIEKQKTIINDLQNKVNTSNSIINNYKNIINQKEVELNNLKIQLQKYNKQNQFYLNEMMCVNFISIDQRLHYAVPCISNNTFAEVEEKLYQKFPEYRETNNNFLANGQKVLRFKTISQNGIGNGLPVTLISP